MSPVLFLLAAASAAVAQNGGGEETCPRIETINKSLKEFCGRPMFVTFLPNNKGNQLIDHECNTCFPLPDDPDTFLIYHSKVYCDGSTIISTFVATDVARGTHKLANPSQTVQASFLGYVGCDNYLTISCSLFGDTGYIYTIQGVSPSCKPIGLSCLRRVEEVMRDNGLPEQEFYALPMKLPNRCVMQQQCIATQGNQFRKALGLAGPIHPY